MIEAGEPQRRVMVVDDHVVVRQGLISLLERPGFRVVAQAASVREALAKARLCALDIVVMDVHLPDGSGIDACRAIIADQPSSRIAMFTASPDEDDLRASINAGAAAYLLKQMGVRELVRALEAMAGGESLRDPRVAGRVLDRIRRVTEPGAHDVLATLNRQERRILALLAEGMTNKQIARSVLLSDKTVKNYVSLILAKLNLERRAEAAAYVVRHRSPTLAGRDSYGATGAGSIGPDSRSAWP
jgi:DNA-binding NarL/FixJ family response regulator